MNFIQRDNNLLITQSENFNPFDSCECGQCFRFNKISDNEYSLIACGRRLNMQKTAEGWLFLDITEEEFCKSFVPYFDLNRDYGSIIKSFSADKTITRAAEAAGGIRIFRQDPWETLISFIISQNNNIPRIKKIIESLCALLGEEKNGVYSFPTPQSIATAGAEGLAPIKSGFRAKYIVDAAEKVLNGTVDLNRVAAEGYDAALAELKLIKGVGDKVANCVLLFGFGYYQAFPIDVWVKRVIDNFYNGDFDPTILGEYAGIAQQYLFYYQRSLLKD
ncbi:MAG: DNA glycosylase [Clostridia bacterium]|nr:DNA glycosylase [Clostridia bacterium]MBR5279081.1 DNA glycosylase [Clostridia bacterium]